MDQTLHHAWHRFLQEQFFVACAYWSAAGLFLYDYCLEFDREFRYVWTARFSVPLLFYYITRYSTLASIVVEVIFSPPHQDRFAEE
ncbi:hypothetical protein B0H21DRAFT_38322 [Amylocystis lapponica]|nr:hypothetical protein B0H21DRAFT_38322 [Amylocystis lapponica]